MDLGLRGKAVVVTGASRGIGKSIALGFADEGANISLCARGTEALEETANEIRERGVRVNAEACDARDGASLASFLEGSRAALGGVDILINNASGFGGTDDEESWLAGWTGDLMPAVRATWTVAPWMEAAGGGSIVHISSIAALEGGMPPAYSAAKAAMISHAKNAAVALASKGIRVNCVAPGSIEFPGGIWDQVKQGVPAHYEATLASIPFGRLGRPEEVSDAVVYLASNRASWISGECIAIDGVQHKGTF
ncbi:MAG: SDR family NAD(P)-dependent oxidoreductase [Candidatus Binatia bacterium]|nr:SDR family NAD(P)-dependent oxidoreductase [Candidatus Binatia bacterium]